MVSKPFSVAIRDTKSELVNVLNNSGLPIDAMNFILSDILREAQKQAEEMYQQEQAEYISELNESREEVLETDES